MRSSLALLAATALLLGGCSTVERGTATSDNGSPIRLSIGVPLRRIVLLAPLVTRKDCESGEDLDGPVAPPSVDVAAIIARLQDWKDYEVSPAERTPASDELVDQLAAWHQKVREATQIPAPLLDRLRSQSHLAGSEAQPTALLVIRSHQRCITMMDSIMELAVVGMPRYFKKMTERNTSIALYDPEKGELLWMAYFHTNVTDDLTRPVLAELENLPAASR